LLFSIKCTGSVARVKCFGAVVPEICCGRVLGRHMYLRVPVSHPPPPPIALASPSGPHLQGINQGQACFEIAKVLHGDAPPLQMSVDPIKQFLYPNTVTI